jgi:hypothetical protein
MDWDGLTSQMLHEAEAIRAQVQGASDLQAR